MASANVNLVRSIYAEWERGDYSSVEWAHPEIEYVIADGPSPGSWTGPAALAEGTRDWLSAFEGFHIAPEEYRELDVERVLVLIEFRGRGKRSQVDLREIHSGGLHLFHIRQGKVEKLIRYFDRERAFAELGLSADAGSSVS